MLGRKQSVNGELQLARVCGEGAGGGVGGGGGGEN